MPLNERNDPEMSYRRGYKDGASEMFTRVERILTQRRGMLSVLGLTRTLTDGG